MFLVILTGLILGMLIPFIASRFGKIELCNPGSELLALWHKPCFPKPKSKRLTSVLYKKWQKMLYFSGFWGILTAGMFLFLFLYMPVAPFLCMAFFYIIFMLMAIDAQFFLLPDFFTIPLLLLGFVASLNGLLPFDEAVFGAVTGYALSVISVLVLAFKKQPEFGGGDVKMLTALGAWLGFENLGICLVISFIFFLVPALVKRTNVGAYGPALGLAAIVTFFYRYFF